MFDRDSEPQPSGSGAGLAALIAGALLGATALLLTTKAGQRLLEQITLHTDDWKAHAAAAIAESREKVVSSVESETPPPPPTDYGQQVRKNL